MSKINTSSEIAKQIKVCDYTLSSDGLWIAYELNGKEIDLIADPEQTCSLLKTHGLIEDYSGAGKEVSVEMDYIMDSVRQGEHVQDSSYQILHWLEFQPCFVLSQREALDIVTKIEVDKVFKMQTDKIRDIPKLIAEMAEPGSVVADMVDLKNLLDKHNNY